MTFQVEVEEPPRQVKMGFDPQIALAEGEEHN